MSTTEATPVKSLDQQLLEVAGTGDVESVKNLLKQGASAKYEKYDEGTWGASHRESVIHAPLMRTYNKEIIKILLENGADVNAQYEDYNWKGSGSTNTAFQVALSKSFQENDVELLQVFLQHGGNPNTPSVREAHTMRYDGRSVSYPLHKAVNGGKPEFVRILLEHGANVNAIATDEGYSEYGSGSNTKETALHLACALSSEAETIVDLLFQYKADVNAEGQHLDNLHVVVEGKDPNEWSDPRSGNYVSNVELIPVLERPIHVALLHGNIQVAFKLVEAGADTTVPWQHGEDKFDTWRLVGRKLDLATYWSPETHRHYPSKIKKLVKLLLLCNKRCRWNLPKEVFRLILQEVIPSWLESLDMHAFLEEKRQRLKKVVPPPSEEEEVEAEQTE